MQCSRQATGSVHFVAHYPQPQAATTMDDSANSRSALLNEVLAANSRYAKTFDSPMSLGVKKKLSVVTCMDSRLMVASLLGLDIGDIEMIRNAGGRVTPDVIRSLFVAQEVPELSTREVLIIHHTDCGAMAALRHHDHLVARMQQLLGQWNILGWLLQTTVSTVSRIVLPSSVLRKKLLNLLVMRPFADPAASVKEDVWLLRHSPLMPADIPIHGLVYDVATGQLHHVTSSLGDSNCNLKQQ